MTATEIAWLVLRIVYAWMFLYPAVGLVKDWPTTVQTTALLFKWKPKLFAAGSVVVMVAGAIMILLGVYGRAGAAGLCAFCLGGARIHYRLASLAGDVKLSSTASPDDVAAAGQLTTLAVVGHVTSAEKNIVLAAVAFFFLLMGTGPWSLIESGPLF